MAYIYIEFDVPDSVHLASWSPPPGAFTEHEATAILRHSPIVDVHKKISVQGFSFIGYNPTRKYDSSAAWVSTSDTPFLCRVLRFFDVSPCCHPDCEVELMAEIVRFESMKLPASMPCSFIAKVDKGQALEYVSASSLLPQVVILIPVIMEAPVKDKERHEAEALMQYGPFFVVDVARQSYQ